MCVRPCLRGKLQVRDNQRAEQRPLSQIQQCAVCSRTLQQGWILVSEGARAFSELGHCVATERPRWVCWSGGRVSPLSSGYTAMYCWRWRHNSRSLKGVSYSGCSSGGTAAHLWVRGLVVQSGRILCIFVRVWLCVKGWMRFVKWSASSLTGWQDKRGVAKVGFNNVFIHLYMCDCEFMNLITLTHAPHTALIVWIIYLITVCLNPCTTTLCNLYILYFAIKVGYITALNSALICHLVVAQASSLSAVVNILLNKSWVFCVVLSILD